MLHFQKKSFFGFHTQKSIKKIDILPSFCSDNSPIIMSYKKSEDISLRKFFWRFKNSFIEDDKCLSEMKEDINIRKQPP